ncbi:MAG: ferritin [Bacteroidales bacterium]|nr:ferritin [Bacteroidales bacterium]
MLSKKIEKAINDQINAEFWSAHLYLSMSAWLSEQNLPGFSNWMYIQYKEEDTHALKFFRYVNERGGRVTLQPIAEVPSEWKSAVDVFQQTLDHERVVTSRIYKIMEIALEEKDYGTVNFLQWYINEQVEEEATAEDYLNKLKMIEKDPSGMYAMDKELGARVFVDATLKGA